MGLSLTWEKGRKEERGLATRGEECAKGDMQSRGETAGMEAELGMQGEEWGKDRKEGNIKEEGVIAVMGKNVKRLKRSSWVALNDEVTRMKTQRLI